MSRYARDNMRNLWRELSPEVREIVEENIRAIRQFWESPNGEKREPSEEGQGKEKSSRQKGKKVEA